MKAIKKFCIVAVLIAGNAFSCYSFGLLSHEAIIDATWEQSIIPALKARFPDATEKQIKEAHPYVYGGAIMPDIGYMPLGSVKFTHYVHYVRTGDFITNLLEEAQNVNEYAFAVGMMSHYFADNYGHPDGTNRVVAIEFPKEREKHGDTVSYEEAKVKHVRCEFGFDVLQTAKGKYKPDAYHDFIGFKVSQAVLERAFRKTYGMELSEVFRNFPAAVSNFRFAVRNLIPELTRDAWRVRKSFITKLSPLATEENFYYKIGRHDYKAEFGGFNIKSTFISLILTVLPKWGPLSFLKFKEPTPRGEKVFDHSFQTIVANYDNELKKGNNIRLSDRNYDTGRKSITGEYKIADDAYDKLLLALQKKNFTTVDENLKKSLSAFYTENPKNKPKKIRKAYAEMESLSGGNTETSTGR